VRVKVDENLPESALRVVRAAGHDVDTVRDEGLVGATDPDVMKAAVESRRMVFTLNRGFAPGPVELRPGPGTEQPEHPSRPDQPTRQS
jgi:predicted nuclease of predicted toxin-antitoxin system